MLVSSIRASESPGRKCDKFDTYFEYGAPAYTFTFRREWGPPDAGPPPHWVLEGRTRYGEPAGRWEFRDTRSTDEHAGVALFRELALSVIAGLDQSIAVHSKKLQADPGALTEMWPYWDFVYFSGISLTTVGYGDILPNKTLIRMLVLAEILLGVFLLVCVLNLLIAETAKRQRG